MKKQFKIMLVAICVVMLSALITVAIAANVIIDDADCTGIQVATAGNINLRFIYSDLGTAAKMVVEVKRQDGALYDTWDVPVAEIEDNVVKVPLTPSQMTYTVTVYAVDENGNKGAEKTTSVLNYAKAILGNDEYSAYHTSMRALLNWGAMSEQFFGAEGITSSANSGLYSRETNPVQDAVAFFNAENAGAVAPSEHITGVNYELFLEPGATTMRFKVAYTGENAANLKAYVQKGTDERVETRLQSLGNGEYYVNIHNVGVAVYTTPYTVIVTDGAETFTATKTVLEYLNTLAFDANYGAKHNIARSMYQFYAQATGAVTPATCAHDSGLHVAGAADGESEYIACSNCLAQMGDRVVDKDVVWFSNPQEFTKYYSTVTQNENNYAEILYENGMPYASFTAAAGEDIEFWPMSTQGYDKSTPDLASTGRYGVIKYRVSGSAKMSLNVGAGTGRAYADEQLVGRFDPDEWVTAVLDFKGCSYYQASGQISVTMGFEQCTAPVTFDIAYFAICDSVESARSLLTDGETYRTCTMVDRKFRDLANYPETNALGKCANEHYPVTSTPADGANNMDVYTYTCSSCGEVVGTRNVPKSLTYYWNPVSVKMWDNNRPGGGNDTDEFAAAKDGEAFVHLNPYYGGKSVESKLTASSNVTYGKYLAIKYRLTARAGTNISTLEFNIKIAGQDNKQTPNRFTDGWEVAIIDISGLNGYSAGSGAFQVRITHRGVLDIAYVAMSDDISVLRALLGENETYFDRGTSLVNAGLEKDKNGYCVNPHADPVFGTEDLDTVTRYTYKCPLCGYDFAPSRDVPKTAYYWNPAQSSAYDNNLQGGGSLKYNPVAKDGEAYVNFTPTGSKAMESKMVKDVTTTLGKYVAIKYRLTPVQGAADRRLTLSVYINGKNTFNINNDDATSQWKIAVVNISGYTNYVSGQQAKITISLSHTYSLDVAYVVMSDDMADIRALLGEKETYFDRGNSFANAGTEYNKNGNRVCTGAHTVTTWTAVVGTTTEQGMCSVCGENATRETVIWVGGGKFTSTQNSQNTLTVGTGKGPMVATTTSTSGSIVIPVTAEDRIKIAPVYVAANGGVVGDYDSSMGGTFYSVDGGETWHWLTAEGSEVTSHISSATNAGVLNAGERMMALLLQSSMFTGANAGNVALALENGVIYGMVPGYNSDYVDGKTVTDPSVIVPFLYIPAEILEAPQ